MEFDEILLVVGGVPVTYGRLMAGVGILAFILLTTAVALAWRAGRARKADSFEAMRRTAELEFKLAELSGHLSAFAEQTAHHDAHLARTLDERLDQVSFRLGKGLSDTAERTSQSLQILNERLAVIDNAQRNITELSSHMVSLKDILANKQTRGAFGQGRMEAIIRDGLHQSAYSFQSTLSNGTRPDCLVKLGIDRLRWNEHDCRFMRLPGNQIFLRNILHMFQHIAAQPVLRLAHVVYGFCRFQHVEGFQRKFCIDDQPQLAFRELYETVGPRAVA